MQFVVTAAESGKMLKQILQNRFHFSRRFFRRLREEQRVHVNGNVIYYTSRLIEGDSVCIRLEDEQETYVLPQKIDFSVVFEDKDILIVNKPAGIVVHPTFGYREGTLANGVAYYANERGESYPFRPVTRLDKDTSGLMVIAKHAYAHAALSKQMKQKRYQRKYVAICHKDVLVEKGTITLPIGNSPTSIIERVIDWENGKEAVTHFQKIHSWKEAAFLSLLLETGRTHQIRVHLAAMGNPIIGDTLYGSTEDTNFITRQALHAKEITIFHPTHREWMTWKVPLASDMNMLLAKLNDHKL